MDDPRRRTPPDGVLPLMISAGTEDALTHAILRNVRHLDDVRSDEFYDLAYTSCLRRAPHPHRAVALAHCPAEAARQFAGLVGDGHERPAGAADGKACAAARAEAVHTGHVALVFNGDGSQWAGMGADLFQEEPAFRGAVEDVDRELAPLVGWSVTDRLTTPPGPWRLDATDIAQPLLFTLQVGLVALLRDRGFRPRMVLGRSLGEVAAAHTAGALTLTQAAHLVTSMSRAMAATTGSGRMAAVGLPHADALAELAALGGRLELAGINSPQDVSVAGDPAVLDEWCARLEQRGVFHRGLVLDSAFHSSAMDPQRAAFLAGEQGLTPHEGDVPFYSSVTGGRLRGDRLTGGYWWQNIRRPVRFAHAVDAALKDGADILLEVGPHPDQRVYLRRIVAARHSRPTVAVLPTVLRDGDGPALIAAAHAALLAFGATPDWRCHFPRPGRSVRLATAI
ncbi:acyltransferase domain-containing protein [Streptomyces coeruleoprunus]|uniref:Acyltransferase domain-containing protein n=1 Tax=Streptomyces coeruleoprunus TaxID=285563 RepID=A0ABV9XB20_9ACTN